ncbi:MAG: UDP-N-acetylmuramoyl-tripeptide--D-alanyl-D-alanine ligase [Coriobacteriales bacterium]|nr:UDP-N-acetylmuramoyl-tripeptide--D-alanyl-D-alanine ligase [Coriobacteriales bacterium]
MLQFSVSEVAAATAATVLVEGERCVTNVVIDSRAVAQGSLFVCFSGEKVDGNVYAPSAIEHGAAAIALTAEPDASVIQLARDHGCALLRAQDDDPTEFMLRLASAWRARNPQWVLVGVTGSVGKTTCKDMLAAGLAVGGSVHATAGNHNNLVGMSLTILSAKASDEFVVCEMGMDHAGELTRLSAVARPDVALITNVGTSHIGNLGSREAIARAKAEICSGMRPTDDAEANVPSCLVMTSDNDFGPLIEQEYAAPAGIKVMRVGATDECAVRTTSITLDDQSFPTVALSFSDGCELFATLDVPGVHVVSDFLLAMAIIWLLGVDRAHAAEAIAHMPRTGMRLEVKQAPGRPRVIDDSYNASPNSMAGALDVLTSMRCEGRRVAVLGEIGELGDDAARLHGYVGAYAAAKHPDMLVIVGSENADHMAEAALTMGFSPDRLERFADGASALSALKGVFGEDDLVLVKASRFVQLDHFAKGVLA